MVAQGKVKPGELTDEEIQAAILQFFEFYPGVTMPETVYQLMRASGVDWTEERMLSQIPVMVADGRLYQREDGAITNDIGYLVA